jgi:hypothetical protein
MFSKINIHGFSCMGFKKQRLQFQTKEKSGEGRKEILKKVALGETSKNVHICGRHCVRWALS